jgi:hypothetical protein
LRQLRQTEVENLRPVLFTDEDIRRLDVAMDDALGVRGIECVRELDRDIQQVRDLQRSTVDAIAEALAPEGLHHDVRCALIVADVEDGADAGVAQGARRACLDSKPLERLVAGRRLRWEELERDLPAQSFVFGEIHDTHAARTECTEYAVVGDGAADHSVRSERGVRRMT